MQTLARNPPRCAGGLGLLAALLLAGPGCVTSGTYEDVVQQRDSLSVEKHRLEERAARLEAAQKSLEAERVRLIEESESLAEDRVSLERDLLAVRAQEADLASRLAEREAELQTKTAEVSKLRGTYEGLVQDLESEVASGQIEIERLREGIRLSVSDEILFASGSAQLGAEGAELLTKVAVQLSGIDQRVEVQGHSDDRAIRGKLARHYPTNWELAGARAARVVRVLELAGVDGQRLSAVSFGPHHPVAPNDTPENRSLNRRIEIRLLPPRDSNATLEPTESR